MERVGPKNAIKSPELLTLVCSQAFCGKYEHTKDEDYAIDEVFMRGGELHARAIDGEGELTFTLLPIGENRFGRKGGYLELTFGDGFLTMNDGAACKKL